MNIWRISIRNILDKPLYTCLSILILAISIALLLGIGQLDSSFKSQMDNNLSNIDLVIGAKGSPLQLVLASVLHMDDPTGNISYKEAKKIGRNPLIKTAIPISYGDNYKGYRILGATDGFANLYNATLEKGRAVKEPMEVVLGHTVAMEQQLKIGDTFLSSHGLIENDVHIHSEHLTVVGIYRPTHKVIDRLIVTNLESIWEVHHENDTEHEKGKSHPKHHEEQEEEKEITSLLVSFRNPSALLTVPRNINKNTDMQAALPKYELDRLYQLTGVGVKTVSWIAYMILLISCMTIFISLFKMVKERAFDLALLRTYGASPSQLIRMVVYEGLLIGAVAFIVGLSLSQIGLHFIFQLIETEYRQRVPLELPYIDLLQTGSWVLSMIFLAVSLAIYPIIKMNISTILSHEK